MIWPFRRRLYSLSIDPAGKEDAMAVCVMEKGPDGTLRVLELTADEGRIREIGIERCDGCPHWHADHLLHLGPFRLCLEDGCACGRRALARLAKASAPWCPVLAAAALWAWHFVPWAFNGFPVVGR